MNYGHTFGHAFETVDRLRQLLHGEAVSIGMMCAARLGRAAENGRHQFVRRQRALLMALGLPVATPELDQDKLLEAMMHDKKTTTENCDSFCQPALAMSR